jgi:KaiC/GvpD/RAD55 family RecA-like ATPase
MPDARSPEFLIEEILPSREVHLLGGPSGAGKTTWLFQMLQEQWKEGGTILDHSVHPVPYIYVSADRSKPSVERTMQRAGINPITVPFFSLVNRPEITSVALLANAVLERCPETRLLVIDGVMRLIPPKRDSSTDGGFAHISKFLIELCKACQDKDLTIILIVHSPKQKEDSRYTNPRERVMGSAAWAAYSETIILVEPFMPVSRDTANARTLICLPRNAGAVFQDLEFTANGRLVLRSDEIDAVLVEQFLFKVKPGEVFTTNQILDALSKSMSRTTVFRWLKRLEDASSVIKSAHGIYKRARAS